MFRRQSCAIFRELTVPDQICYTNIIHTGHLIVNEHPLSLSPVCSIHDVSVTDLIRNCELPEDGTGLAIKHVGAAGHVLVY
jgi:hypothetical protein